MCRLGVTQVLVVCLLLAVSASASFYEDEETPPGTPDSTGTITSGVNGTNTTCCPTVTVDENGNVYVNTGVNGGTGGLTNTTVNVTLGNFTQPNNITGLYLNVTFESNVTFVNNTSVVVNITLRGVVDCIYLVCNFTTYVEANFSQTVADISALNGYQFQLFLQQFTRDLTVRILDRPRTPTTNGPDPPDDDGLSTGAILAIVYTVLGFFLCVGVLYVFWQMSEPVNQPPRNPDDTKQDVTGRKVTFTPMTKPSFGKPERVDEML